MADYDRIRELLNSPRLVSGDYEPMRAALVTELRAHVRALLPATGLTPDQVFCQRLAEQYWAAATSDNHGIAWYRSPVYKHLAQAFIASVEVTYGVSRTIAARVRCLLAEYGPDDSLTGTSGRGVASYVEFARDNSSRRYVYLR